MPDVRVDNQGTIFLFHLQTKAASDWVDEHVQDDAQYWGGTLVVEHRYAPDLADGMLADGLTVIDEFGPLH